MVIESRLQSIIMILPQVSPILSQEKYLIDFLLKTNLWTYKIKDLNEEITIGTFNDNELLSITSQSY